MKLYSTLILSFLISTILSQERKDYIVKLNNDTVFTKVIKIDLTMKTAICEEHGRKIKYKAKDVLAVKIDTIFYESALVRSKGLKNKEFVFLQRTVRGNLNLYEIKLKRTKFLMKTFGDDLIHARWIYRAHDWTKDVLVVVYFYKKENETRENFSRNWKEKTKDCKLLLDKINSKETVWIPTPEEMVQFYNINCK